MNKKLMAVAVAGALAAPGLALAQVSTVQIYGVFNVEYGVRANQPNNAAGLGRHDTDALNSGASRIGFKGEEKLGGGLSAWFQCESDARFAGATAVQVAQGWCGRNTALGLKGPWGDVFIGTWDSPLKLAVGTTRITNEVGWLGTQHILLSPVSHPTVNSGFSNRNQNSVNYVTPTFNGFSARAAYTTAQAALNSLSTAATKGREVGLSAQYASGPLAVVAGYAKKDDNISAAGCAGCDDRAWAIGASYVFGPVKVGLTYTDADWNTTAVLETERKSWNLAADWKITGPGTIRAGYAHAGDYKGSAGVANSGAKQWQIGYNHALSKRTVAGIGYVRVNNDSGGRYNLTGLAAGPANVQAGDDSNAFSISLTHTF